MRRMMEWLHPTWPKLPDAVHAPRVPEPIESLYTDAGYDRSQLYRVHEWFHAIEMVEKMGKVPRIEWNRDSIGQRRMALYADDAPAP